MHGSLPKACPPHTHIAPRLDAVQVANFDDLNYTEFLAQWQSGTPVIGKSRVRARAAWFVCSFGVATLSFVLWHILFAAFLCARLQLLCFAFLFFYVCSLRFYVF